MALKPFEKRKDFKDIKSLLKNRKISDFIKNQNDETKKVGDQ